MAKQKLNAAQRRLRKQAQKLARALYESGKTPAAQPRSTSARQRIREEMSRAQSEEAAYLSTSAAAVTQMSKQDAVNLLRDLHDAAYHRYYMLMQQGTPNAATAKYEAEFAGLNPDRMTINEIRAKIAALQRWLKRKDASPKRAKRKQRKDVQWLKTHGFPDVTADDLEDFYDTYAKYLEYAGYGTRYIPKRLAAFASVYSQLEEPDMPDALKRIDEEMRKQYERETGDTFGDFELSSGNGVQSPDTPGIPAPGQKQPRAPRSNRGRRQSKKQRQQRQQKRRKLAARKKKKR